MDRAGTIAAQNVFGLAHPEFYETLSHYAIAPLYVDRLKTHLPDTWTTRRFDVWVQARAGGKSAAQMATQGFKIHVSSTPAHALRVLDLVVPECVGQGVDFKIAGDPGLLNLLNSKLQGRGQSGKFMTIYPPDEESFKGLIERLYQRTRAEAVEGPYILSDRPYRDSKILFYRYGGFLPPQRLNVDGTQTSFLVSPAGEYVPDRRVPYFQLPPWVDDPFAAAPAAAAQEAGGHLNNRYAVKGALSFSNAGGVYFGIDTATDQSVVIKEARPHTNCWSIGNKSWDAVHLLRREYRVLRHLEGLSFVPSAVELFKEWEHTFLVEERVDGLSLDSYWAQEEVLLAPYVRRPGRIERFVPRLKHVAEALVSMVREVHARGVLLGDLSPRNILINAETLRISFIDFESAVLADDNAEMSAYASRWATPGFAHPARASRGELLPEDDFYSVAMILYGGVVPINYFFALNPEAQAVFLDKFVTLGLPAEVRDVINSLLRGDVEQAQAVLAHWDV
jgi:hypothetical protein